MRPAYCLNFLSVIRPTVVTTDLSPHARYCPGNCCVWVFSSATVLLMAILGFMSSLLSHTASDPILVWLNGGQFQWNITHNFWNAAAIILVYGLPPGILIRNQPRKVQQVVHSHQLEMTAYPRCALLSPILSDQYAHELLVRPKVLRDQWHMEVIEALGSQSPQRWIRQRRWTISWLVIKCIQVGGTVQCAHSLGGGTIWDQWWQ